MSHLGFGGHLLHGTPDIGCLTLAGTIYETGGNWPETHTCNKKARVTTSIEEALGTCQATHGNWNFIQNPCGNLIRNFVIKQFDKTNKTNNSHIEKKATGYPNFVQWPKYNDILHQQMWIEWIRRAYDGGLRMIVALAVNNLALAVGLQPNDNIYDDKTSIDLQIKEIKSFALRHSDWMEVAYSSTDMRHIIGDDKFAIIIGTEYDDIGNFMFNKIKPTKEQIQNEIQRLYDSGVRYMFPVHVTDNLLGGTSLYEPAFFVANRYQFGKWAEMECATEESGVTHNFTASSLIDNVITNILNNVQLALVGGKLGSQEIPACKFGHINKRGLQKLGEYAIKKMMNLHIIIDIDHMSRHTTDSVIELTNNYPLMSGHTSYPTKKDNFEINKNVNYYKNIASRGGMAGIKIGHDLKTTINDARKIANLKVPLAIGSDLNGYVTLNPPPPPDKSLVIYSTSFPQLTTGKKTFDYNTEGMVNIGLYPDFLRAMVASGGKDVVKNLFSGAENFARMWSKCESFSDF